MTFYRYDMKNAHTFAAGQLEQAAERVTREASVAILGTPGAGITLFLKQLANHPIGHTVYLDVFSLPEYTVQAFFAALLVAAGGSGRGKDTVEELVTACQLRLAALPGTERIVVCIAGFDQLQPAFSPAFFRYIRAFRANSAREVSFVFGICQPLERVLPGDMVNTDLQLFSRIFYLQPYTPEDMRALLQKYGPYTDLPEGEIDQLIALSGGHFQLLQLLISSERRHQPVQDPFIQLACQNIWNNLSHDQQACLRKIVHGSGAITPDMHLLHTGIIRQDNSGLTLFSPLFTEYIRRFSLPSLPLKERRLLSLLKKNKGKVVSKREIYDAVWRGSEVGTEWALNALIYRLRKHPAFIAQNYTIESRKKLGYVLTPQ